MSPVIFRDVQLYRKVRSRRMFNIKLDVLPMLIFLPVVNNHKITTDALNSQTCYNQCLVLPLPRHFTEITAILQKKLKRVIMAVLISWMFRSSLLIQINGNVLNRINITSCLALALLIPVFGQLLSLHVMNGALMHLWECTCVTTVVLSFCVLWNQTGVRNA